MSFWNVLKVSSSFIVMGYLAIAVMTGFVTFFSTGELKPLLDNTLGILISPDERAYSAVNELTNFEVHNKNPEKYTEAYLLYLRHQIVLNLAIAFLVIYGVYKLFSFFAGIHVDDPSTKIMLVVFAILSYFVLGAIYQILMYVFFGANAGDSLVWQVIPMKGFVSSIINAPTIFSVQAPIVSVVSLNTTNVSVVL